MPRVVTKYIVFMHKCTNIKYSYTHICPCPYTGLQTLTHTEQSNYIHDYKSLYADIYKPYINTYTLIQTYRLHTGTYRRIHTFM